MSQHYMGKTLQKSDLSSKKCGLRKLFVEICENSCFIQKSQKIKNIKLYLLHKIDKSEFIIKA